MRSWLVVVAVAGCDFQGKGDLASDAATDTALITDASPDGDWWNPDWGYRRRITIDNSATTQRLVDFPALVTLPASFDYANALTDLADVRFVGGDGIELAHDLDTFANFGTSTLWVKQSVEERSQPQPVLWMYYGNAAAVSTASAATVWTGNVSVHHLGDLRDATNSGHTATAANTNSTPTMVLGTIGQARQFDGSNDALTLIGESAYDFTDAMSASVWINVAAFTQDWQAIVCKGDRTWRLHRGGGGPRIAFTTSLDETADNNDNLDIATDVTFGSWHHLAVVYADTTKSVYFDGTIAKSSFTGPINTGDFSVTVGENDQQTGRFFEGIIDELRISQVPRSSDWVAAEYRVVTDPTFVVLGDPEQRP